jgi:hypothetical protein
LKDYYWLKVNRFLLSLRSVSTPNLVGASPRSESDEEIKDATQEALRALRALISHMKACYSLDREHAA